MPRFAGMGGKHENSKPIDEGSFQQSQEVGVNAMADQTEQLLEIGEVGEAGRGQVRQQCCWLGSRL